MDVFVKNTDILNKFPDLEIDTKIIKKSDDTYEFTDYLKNRKDPFEDIVSDNFCPTYLYNLLISNNNSDSLVRTINYPYIVNILDVLKFNSITEFEHTLIVKDGIKTETDKNIKCYESVYSWYKNNSDEIINLDLLKPKLINLINKITKSSRTKQFVIAPNINTDTVPVMYGGEESNFEDSIIFNDLDKILENSDTDSSATISNNIVATPQSSSAPKPIIYYYDIEKELSAEDKNSPTYLYCENKIKKKKEIMKNVYVLLDDSKKMYHMYPRNNKLEVEDDELKSEANFPTSNNINNQFFYYNMNNDKTITFVNHIDDRIKKYDPNNRSWSDSKPLDEGEHRFLKKIEVNNLKLTAYCTNKFDKIYVYDDIDILYLKIENKNPDDDLQKHVISEFKNIFKDMLKKDTQDEFYQLLHYNVKDISNTIVDKMDTSSPNITDIKFEDTTLKVNNNEISIDKCKQKKKIPTYSIIYFFSLINDDIPFKDCRNILNKLIKICNKANNNNNNTDNILNKLENKHIKFSEYISEVNKSKEELQKYLITITESIKKLQTNQNQNRQAVHNGVLNAKQQYYFNNGPNQYANQPSRWVYYGNNQQQSFPAGVANTNPRKFFNNKKRSQRVQTPQNPINNTKQQQSQQNQLLDTHPQHTHDPSISNPHYVRSDDRNKDANPVDLLDIPPGNWVDESNNQIQTGGDYKIVSKDILISFAILLEYSRSYFGKPTFTKKEFISEIFNKINPLHNYYNLLQICVEYVNRFKVPKLSTDPITNIRNLLLDTMNGISLKDKTENLLEMSEMSAKNGIFGGADTSYDAIAKTLDIFMKLTEISLLKDIDTAHLYQTKGLETSKIPTKYTSILFRKKENIQNGYRKFKKMYDNIFNELKMVIGEDKDFSNVDKDTYSRYIRNKNKLLNLSDKIDNKMKTFTGLLLEYSK